jgi:hypothetical protein
MKKLFGSVLLAVAVLALALPSAMAQNLLANPSFEDPSTITTDGPPFIGSWEAFQGGTATSVRATVDPHSGDAHMSLNTLENNQFAGMFQDVVVAAGNPVTFSVWHKTTDTLFSGTEMRIEWRNSVSDTEISRTPNLATAPTLDYTLLALDTVVPAGVDIARVVYAIQSFGAGPDVGTVYVDDASVTTIPEPATMALIGMSIIGFAGLRRGGRVARS